MGIVRLFPHLRLVLCVCAVLIITLCVFLTRAPGQALSAELSPLQTRLFGQNRWLRGGPAAVRLIASDHRDGTPVHAHVTLSLVRLNKSKPEGTPAVLYDGVTNNAGTLDAHFTAPRGKPGPYQLTAAVISPLGRDEITQPIQLEESVQVMLTADKPLYQPGQTIHLRALALDLATRVAVSGEPLTFEVEDARANKVFKQAISLSSFGLAAVDFTLADEVNMGTYTLRAVLPEGQTEKKVRVERYVLPKFKTALTTDKPYYLPGDTVKGSVQADYFFGKPVSGGEVTVEVVTADVGVTKLAELTGTTDASGTYKFEYTLPDAFYGQPFEQGKAALDLHGIVMDTADHRQDVNTTVPVVKDPVSLVLVPESRQLAPGLCNRLFISAATPDGAPLKDTDLSVTTSQDAAVSHCRTDGLGLATFDVAPGDGPVTVTVSAVTADGRSGQASTTLSYAGSTEGLLVRADRSILKVGERLRIGALTSAAQGTVYLDLIRNKQTILTCSLAIGNGRASTTLTITPDMVGTLELHAYKILPNEDIIRDTQTIIVTPADNLLINVATDKPQYQPGEDATLTFSVTDQQQHPILAALGLAIVDESVFALSELQPGLEKLYFTLEKELMEPKYEIHGLTPSAVVLDQPTPSHPVLADAERQRAAAMLLAAVPAGRDFDFRIDSYQQRWDKLRARVLEEMRLAHQKIIAAVQQYNQEQHTVLTAQQGLFRLVDAGYLKLDELKDHWGNFYQSDLQGQQEYTNWLFTLRSAGPDGRWGTADDIAEERVMGIDGNFVWNANVEMRDGVMPLTFAAPAPMVVTAAMPGAVNGTLALAHVAAPGLAPTENTAQAASNDAPRVREYFPETMYWNPAIITDAQGKAQMSVPLADSITTWRMSLTANSAAGQLGSASAPLRVFQDFFVDIDLPLSLTQHDRVEVPVSVYNYLPEAQQVTLTLAQGDWFALDGPDTQTVQMGENEVKVVYFPIVVNAIGHFSFTVQAKGTRLSDAVRRAVDVLPDGKETRAAISDQLQGKVEKTVSIPTTAVDGASTIWVKLYPGSFSQVVDGLDGMLQMPYGCFEQTSSSTYPNVLILNYLQATKRLNPEIQMKAEQYINVGYQRLLTFECKHGGFSWFGNEPAHQVLTAYGLLEFADMAKVHEVDPALISRTQQWLASQQHGDGSWEEKGTGIAEGIINRQTGALRTTAYLAWALAESGYQGAEVGNAVQYVKAHRSEAKDPYTQAVILNLLTCVERDGDTAAAVARDLIAQATTTEKTACWQGNTETFTGAVAGGADLETTGLAAYALAKWGRNSGFTSKALLYLIQQKNSTGAWNGTQATVWSLKALLFASSAAFGGGAGTVTVLANGVQAKTFTITAADSDVMRQLDLAAYIHPGNNTIALRYNGAGSLLYQIVSRYYLPWAQISSAPKAAEPLSINVAYDKTTLAQNDTATVTVTISNTAQPRATVEMPLIDLGLPPGFTPVTDALDDAVQAKRISKYSIAARQIIVYLEQLKPDETVTLTYALKAKYPIKARTPASAAYPYYNPERIAVVAPGTIVVHR